MSGNVSEAPALLAERRAIFDGLLARSEAYFQAKRPLAAAVHAEIAANYAMSRHTGLFTSPRLETLLRSIGCEAVATAHPAPRLTRRGGSPGTGPDHVLHVLTSAHGIGGHTRMVWRWIQQDAGRRHSVVLTRQGAAPVPSALTEITNAAGGQVHVLNRQRGNVLTWAATLAELAMRADTVVLHTHPYDITPSLALADKARVPPVILTDHADHAFWVGTGVSDVVMALRDTGARLAQARRGIPPERSAVLPIVLPPIERTLSRAEARQKLGIPESAVLLLSIARPHKYLPVNGLDFLEGVLPIIKRYPGTLLWVVGAEPSEMWTRAAERTGGRVRALGLRTDTPLYYQAADIYVDSFPIVSITSLLEAGSYGLPLVSRCWPDAEGTVLAADTPGLAQCLIQVCDTAGQDGQPRIAAYQAALALLIEDPAHRVAVGEHARTAIAGVHCDESWRIALEAVYQQAHALPPNRGPQSASDEGQPPAGPVDAWLPQLFASELDLDSIYQYHLQLMPLDLRLSQWARLSGVKGRGRPLSPGLLLPDWLGAAVAQWRHR